MASTTQRTAKKKLPQLPPFNRQDPMKWFRKLELIFASSNFTNVEDQYKLILSKLPRAVKNDNYFKNFYSEEILKNSITSGYGNMFRLTRSRVMHVCTTLDVAKATKQLNGEEIGDRTPSHFLWYLRWFFDNKLSYQVLYQVWKDHLSVNAMIFLSDSYDAWELDDLAALADLVDPSMSNTESVGNVRRASLLMTTRRRRELSVRVLPEKVAFDPNV